MPPEQQPNHPIWIKIILIIPGILLILGGLLLFSYYSMKTPELTQEQIAEQELIEQKLLAQGIVLPPDPGEAGKMTLEGIDSDNDGVRDDAQRWIWLNYSTRPSLLKPLAQLAKSQLDIIKEDSDSKTVMISLADQRGDALNCLSATLSSTQTLSEAIREAYGINIALKSVLTNTETRQNAFARSNQLLSGTSNAMTDPSTWASQCESELAQDLSIDVSNWQTYRNDEYGFEIKYPNDWVVENKDNYLKIYKYGPRQSKNPDALEFYDGANFYIGIEDTNDIYLTDIDQKFSAYGFEGIFSNDSGDGQINNEFIEMNQKLKIGKYILVQWSRADYYLVNDLSYKKYLLPILSTFKFIN